MDYLAGIQGNKVKFKDDGGNTNGAAQIQQAQNELASIFQEQESVNTEIETKETEIAENNEQEQQQVQEITDALSSAQSDFEAAHSAFQEADSSASSAESNASALAAAAESLPKEIEEEVPDGTDANGKPKTKKVKKTNPAYIAAKAEAEAAKAQADELRNQANSLKEQEAQAQEVCNEMMEALSELESEQEEKEQETEEKDSELETLKEQYNQFQERINELNTEIEQAEQEAQQEEKEPDEEGMALYESANAIDGMDQRYVDNGDGTRTIINPDGTQSTVAIDEKTGNIAGITDNEGNSTTYEFNTTKDKEGNVTANLNKSTTKEKGTNNTATVIQDENGAFDTQKTDNQGNVLYEQDANKDETVVTSTTDANTGIKTTIDENGNVTYKDENGEELSQREVREQKYEESIEDYEPSVPEDPINPRETPRGDETPETPYDDEIYGNPHQSDDPTDNCEGNLDDIPTTEIHIKELRENPDKVFTELLQEDITKAVNIMEYAEDIEKEFIDALYSLPEDKKNEYTDQIIDTLIDFGENTNNRTRPGNFVLDILENKDDNSSNFVERFVEKAPNEFLEKCFEDNQFAEDIIDLLPYVTETTYTRLEECGLNKVYTRMLEEKGLNGEIEDSSQGYIGDCWLLAGINALGNCEAGQKILDEAVTEKEDGSGYVINFKGLNKEIEISNIEILDAIKTGEYSTGDADMVMWELAFEKARDKGSNNNATAAAEGEKTKNDHSTITGGYLKDVTTALMGKKTIKYQEDMNKNITDNSIANIVLKPFLLLADGMEFVTGRTLNDALKKIEKSNDHMVAQVSFQSTFDGKPRYVTDINGEKHMVCTECHAWTIKKVEGDNVTIINPWDSSKEITVSRSEIRSNAYKIEYLDLSEDQ